MSANNIPITFRVAGADLTAYMDNVKRKGEELGNSAIRSAMQQSNAGKEQLKIINEILAATERRAKVEIESARSVAKAKRDEALKANADKYDAEREKIYGDQNLSDEKREKKLSAYDRLEQDNTQRINRQYQDELHTLHEQEKQSKLQTLLAREQLQTSKEAAREQVKSIREGDKTLADVYKEIGKEGSQEGKLTIGLIKDQLEQDRKREQRESGKAGNSILGSILSVDNFNRLAGSATQMVQTQNGFDAIQSTSSTAGRIIGGVLGGLIGGLATGGTGAILGAGIGSSLLGEVMGDAGAIKQKQALLTQEFLKARNRYKGITGFEPDISHLNDLSAVGIDATSYVRMQGEYARRRGSLDEADKTTRQAIFLEKGYGVDQSTSSMLIELQRSSKDNNRDLAQLIGGILERGKGSIFKNGDTSFLSEFLGKFTGIQKELLKTNTTVSSGITMDILKQFNSMGGMFDARDPRSSGLINSINSSLSNPQSDNMKALEYRILSRQYPSKGLFSLQEEMQKGLGSPALLKGIMEQVERVSRGGDEEEMMLHLSGALKGVPLSAIRTLVENRRRLKRFDSSELRSIGISEDVLKSRAEGNTAPIERLTAENTNKVLAGAPIQAAIDSITEALENAFSGAVINIDANAGSITLKANNANIQGNQTQKPSNSQMKKVLIGNGINPTTMKPVITHYD